MDSKWLQKCQKIFEPGIYTNVRKMIWRNTKMTFFLKMSDLSDLLNRTRWFRFFWEFPKFWIFLILLYWHRCNFLKFLGSSFFQKYSKNFLTFLVTGTWDGKFVLRRSPSKVNLRTSEDRLKFEVVGPKILMRNRWENGYILG